MGQTGTCPEAPESLKGEKFYRVFADGFWDLGEFDSVLTGLQVPHLHAFPGVPVAQMLILGLGLTFDNVAFQQPESCPQVVGAPGLEHLAPNGAAVGAGHIQLLWRFAPTAVQQDFHRLQSVCYPDHRLLRSTCK